jgi:hypothetical protein
VKLRMGLRVAGQVKNWPQLSLKSRATRLVRLLLQVLLSRVYGIELNFKLKSSPKIPTSGSNPGANLKISSEFTTTMPVLYVIG